MKCYVRIVSACLLVCMSGCDFNSSVSARSGTSQDDYLEEPLARKVEKYESALLTSNSIIDLLIQSNYEDVYNKYFSESAKSEMPEAQFKTSMEMMQQRAGSLETYKEMQWHFFSGAGEGLELLMSVKIAEHEKNKVKYLFVFDKNSSYNNIVGFSAKSYQGVLTPGQF